MADRKDPNRLDWFDGLTPEEQLKKLDEEEALVRGSSAGMAPMSVFFIFGNVQNLLGAFEGMRKRIRAGLHPIDLTPEEKADSDAFWGRVDAILDEPPQAPAHRPYEP